MTIASLITDGGILDRVPDENNDVAENVGERGEDRVLYAVWLGQKHVRPQLQIEKFVNSIMKTGHFFKREKQ